MQTQRNHNRVDDDRTSVSVEALKRSIMNHLFYLRGTLPETATAYDYYIALVYTVRDRLLASWLATGQTYQQQPVKRVVYLAPHGVRAAALETHLINLGIDDAVSQALKAFGLEFNELLQQSIAHPEEPGQLATQHLDALTTLEIPAIAYGIRHAPQEAESLAAAHLAGIQAPSPYPSSLWEISRPEQAVEVNVGGHTEAHVDEQGRFYVRWVPDKVMRGVPYDLPISGYRTHTVNTMRLWSASRLAVDGGQPEAGRLAQQLLHSAFSSPAVSSPLSHPTGSDESAEVGLNQVQPQNQAQQQIQSAQPQLLHDYFLISCALQDMLRLHCVEGKRSIATFSQAFSLQLHESQHTLAVAELMRLLLDCHQLDWDRAWQITQATIVYVPSNATAKPLVHWSRQLLQQTLPRHLELIYEINQRFLADVRDRSSGDDVQARHLSLIDDNNENLRMMHLGYVGSHVVINPTLSPQSFHHERLRDFQTLFPDKFKHQESRSISHRSLLAINPPLTQLLIDTLGKHWLHHCQDLRQLEALLETSEFHQRWRSIKQAHKQDWAGWVQQQLGLVIEPQALLSVQLRPISAVQRQLLSLFYVITLYNRLKREPALPITPRTFVFNLEVANLQSHADRLMSDQIAQLIAAVAQVVNSDPASQNAIKVVCCHPATAPMRTLYAAADLGEQIAAANTAGWDLWNLKLGLNGALTIGALNEASLVLRQQVGEGNFFLFGLMAEEVTALQGSGYDPWHFYQHNRELQGVIDRIATGYFSADGSDRFKPLIDAILEQDEYLLLADYPFYVDCQDQIAAIYADADWWTRLSILTSARIGQSSCDRLLQEFCQTSWQVFPIPVSGG